MPVKTYFLPIFTQTGTRQGEFGGTVVKVTSEQGSIRSQMWCTAGRNYHSQQYTIDDCYEGRPGEQRNFQSEMKADLNEKDGQREQYRTIYSSQEILRITAAKEC
jgi:hypothetical protein